jgi:Rtf2 RING-finger
MGNDGGSIPTRRELVKEAARNLNTTEVKEKQKEVLAHRWSTCPLSHKPLIRPVVSDSAGNLHNKDAVLQYLLPPEASSLDKDECDKFVQGRIKALKDVVEVHFELDPQQQSGMERWICPITTKALGPSVKAVYIVPCGHAFSQEAVREMKADKCLQCDQPYEARDIIPILPITEAEQISLTVRMEALAALGLTHSLKKASGSSKKRKANGTTKVEPEVGKEVPQLTEVASTAKDSLQGKSAVSQSGTLTPKIANGIKNAATANLTAKVLEEEETRKKRRKVIENENLQSLFSKGTSQQQRNADFMTRGFSIPAGAKHQ